MAFARVLIVIVVLILLLLGVLSLFAQHTDIVTFTNDMCVKVICVEREYGEDCIHVGAFTEVTIWKDDRSNAAHITLKPDANIKCT